MKYFLIIFFIFFLFESKAQNYKCEYKFNDDVFELTLNKATEYSYEFTMNFTSEEFILFENEDYLILGNPLAVSDKEIVYRNIFLDKKNKLISLTSVIEPKYYSSYPRGVWGDALGRCE
jgi:hypothetical protein